VDEDVERGEAAEHHAGHVAERGGVHPGEGVTSGRGEQGLHPDTVGLGRVVAGEVGARHLARAGIRPGPGVGQQGAAQLQRAQQVVEQLMHVPLGARSGLGVVGRRQPLDDGLGGGAGPLQCGRIHTLTKVIAC
jgi:hypothetical protein